MKLMRRSAKMMRWLVAACVVMPFGSDAEMITFTVDETQSAASLSGTVMGYTIQAQSAGSLTAHYAGTIKAEFTGSTLRFPGASEISALNSGSWEPGVSGVAGSAPANYGAKISPPLSSGKAAVRDVLLDLTSDVIGVTDGVFPSPGLRFTYSTNPPTPFDYSYNIFLVGSGQGRSFLGGVLTNAATTNASLVTQGGQLILSIPVDITGKASAFSTNDVVYRLRGVLVASAPALAPITISSFTLAPAELGVTISTTPGRTYSVLGYTNLAGSAAVLDQFTATNSTTTRTIPRSPTAAEQYFRVRLD
jgi:hypothetical protein